MVHPNMTLDLDKQKVVDSANEANKMAKIYQERTTQLIEAQANGGTMATHPGNGKDVAIADVIAEYDNLVNTLTQNADILKAIASKLWRQ